MSGARLTTQLRLGVGQPVRNGASAAYRPVVPLEGEPHLVRDDLLPPGGQARPVAQGPSLGRGRALACLVHITDLQLADVQSPARFEFLNRYFADPRYARIVPTQRPQEALTARAVDATLRTINTVSGPATGLAPHLAITTGDAIDNAQWNELQAFLALFDGGSVTFGPPGGGRYQGVQSLAWPDDIFWRPDGDGPDGPDIFRREFGFPHHAGLLERAIATFRSPGLTMNWLSCFGNHEALNQGVGVHTPGLVAAVTGGVKPIALAEGFDHERALELFMDSPEIFMTGPTLPVTAHPDRRPVTRAEFVAAHFAPGARPAGHGFTERNRNDGTAYFAYDTPAIRFIALDTACLAGGGEGCVDADQARWLESQLRQVHSVYLGTDGEPIRTGNEDRLVIIFSHHGLEMLTNTRQAGGEDHRGPDRLPLLAGPDVARLLHRFGNVVLWLNGHTHANAIRPRPAQPVLRGDAGRPRAGSAGSASGPGTGFWEVTTCSVVDWPCQTRLVEIVEAEGEIRIVCTMLDHAARSRRSPDEPGLAWLHRELAANMPFLGADSGRDGTAADRNVVLRMPAPFPLGRLAT
jgi:metallophosphoesterase (TIGR03767 family)